jgi:hypothetical protein
MEIFIEFPMTQSTKIFNNSHTMSLKIIEPP